MQPLRIHILTEEDPFYLPVFFREFFDKLARERFVVTGLDITPPLNAKSHGALARKLHNLYGTFDFMHLGFRYAIQRAKDILLPQSAWAGTVKRISYQHGVPCSEVSNVNACAYVERVRALQVDLLISVAASQIFKEELLAVPRLDAINIHTGTLPEYRGMLPVFWQMYDGRQEIGITIHTMTPQIDLGEILAYRAVPLHGNRNLDLAIREMKKQGAHLMLALLGQYYEDSVKRTPMDRSRESYRSFPGAAEGKSFRRMGYRLL
jgi:methionyl-tRNA formyltransferase